MTPAKSQVSSEKRLEEATAWHVQLTSGDVEKANWAGFTEWLEADDANRAAFAQVENFYAELDSVADAFGPVLSDEGSSAKVVSLASARSTAWPSRAILGAGLALLAASLVFFVDLGPFAPGSNRLKTTQYTTQVGKTETVKLADGSVIDLNTNTKVAVSLGGAVRRVRLDQGEALFRVAKDPAHPFVITAGDMDIRDVGTVFNVLRYAKLLTVTVAEGKVAVSSHAATGLQSGDVTQLAPGDQLVHKEGNSTVTVRRANPAAVLGWRDGYLSYDNAPLSQVVSDLNRYFPAVILVQGDAASRPFSGVLRMDDETAVLDRLAKFLSIEVVRDSNGTITLRIKPGSN